MGLTAASAARSTCAAAATAAARASAAAASAPTYAGRWRRWRLGGGAAEGECNGRQQCWRRPPSSVATTAAAAAAAAAAPFAAAVVTAAVAGSVGASAAAGTRGVPSGDRCAAVGVSRRRRLAPAVALGGRAAAVRRRARAAQRRATPRVGGAGQCPRAPPAPLASAHWAARGLCAPFECAVLIPEGSSAVSNVDHRRKC